MFNEFPEEKVVNRLRRMCPAGTRVALEKMEDPYDNAAMDEQIEFATVLANSVTFHFRDGQKVERSFSYKQGTKWSAERRERQCQTLKTVESDAQPFSTEGDRSEKKWPKS